MKTWIVSSLDEETIQGRKLFEEIRYIYQIYLKDNIGRKEFRK